MALKMPQIDLFADTFEIIVRCGSKGMRRQLHTDKNQSIVWSLSVPFQCYCFRGNALLWNISVKIKASILFNECHQQFFQSQFIKCSNTVNTIAHIWWLSLIPKTHLLDSGWTLQGEIKLWSALETTALNRWKLANIMSNSKYNRHIMDIKTNSKLSE